MLKCFQAFSKPSRDEALQSSEGREFQRVEAATPKALSSKVQTLVWATESRAGVVGCKQLYYILFQISIFHSVLQ